MVRPAVARLMYVDCFIIQTTIVSYAVLFPLSVGLSVCHTSALLGNDWCKNALQAVFTASSFRLVCRVSLSRLL